VDGAVLDPVGMTALNILSLVIFDTGASLAISPHRSEFLDVKPLAKRTQLGGMGKGLEIEGIGALVWTFDATDGSEVEIRTNAYYVPGAKARLLGPQKLFDKKRGVIGHFYGDEDKFSLKIGNCPEIEVGYCTTSGLLIVEARCGPDTKPTANLSVLDDENTNLKKGEKLLLEWHYRFKATASSVMFSNWQNRSDAPRNQMCRPLHLNEMELSSMDTWSPAPEYRSITSSQDSSVA
jgi:hypothetical protein